MSVNAISGMTGATNTAAASSTSAIKDDTKKKLAALGIDSSNIKTEAEAQQQIKQVQQEKAQHAQAAQANKGGSSQAEIKSEATSLAEQMGITVGNEDQVSTIMDNLATKLTELKAAAGTDETKISEYQNYQTQYDTLNQEYQQSQMISASMDGMANYNKVLLGLS
jgi:hypothetical protein